MPKAAIDEYRDLGPRKYQISRSTQVWHRAHAHSIPKAKCVDR